MISAFFKAIFYTPLYNALVFLAAIIPGNDLGIAIIALTLLVKIALSPLSHRSMAMQRKMRTIDGDIKAIKEKHKDPQDQALRIMNLYREHGINPFSGLFVTLIQIPIIFGLYFVFRAGIDLSSPLIYSFSPRPEHISTMFLGIIDLSKSNIYIALLAGITQFVQTQLAIPPLPAQEEKKDLSFKDEFAKSLNFQARFMVPIIVFIVSLRFTAALPLYWVTSNLFAIGHELLIRRKAEKILAQ